MQTFKAAFVCKVSLNGRKRALTEDVSQGSLGPQALGARKWFMPGNRQEKILANCRPQAAYQECASNEAGRPQRQSREGGADGCRRLMCLRHEKVKNRATAGHRHTPGHHAAI